MDGTVEEAAENVGGVGGDNDNNEDVEMKDASTLASPKGSGEASSNGGGTAEEDNERDVQLYVNWAEQAAAARRPVEEPLPESLILVMARVFNNDMLVENILEKVIFDNDRATMRSCRLVSKTWLISLAKLFRKMKKPQFLVNTNKDAINLNEPRPRPMFEQHTLLYEFIKPMTTNIRHEGFIPTFSLTLGPSYFRKNNYTDFVNCLVQCGSSLVELYIHFPKNSAMSFLLPPDISLPSLNTFGVSFSGQSLLGHHFPVPYHHQHDYFPNNCSIHLVQSILNASKTLRKFHFLHCNSPMTPPDLENLYLPDTLATVHIETPLREFELLLRKPFPCLTEIRINSTIALYSEETIYELLSKLSSTLRTIWLTGPPATRRSLPIKLPRLEHVTKFYMFKPWEFDESASLTNFEEVFPNLETLVFANQTQYSFNYLMKGMRSTTVTSFCVCLTSYRPTHPGLMVHIQEDLLNPPAGGVGGAGGAGVVDRNDDRGRREQLQMRYERMRELAQRAGAGQRVLLQRREQVENNNQNQPAGAGPPAQGVGDAAAARRRAAIMEDVVMFRREDAQRRVQERMIEMQIRNQLQMQQHLQQLRELRERYERYARVRRYPGNNDNNPQQPPAAGGGENRNNNNRNGNDLNNADNNQHRPVLEIRRVGPSRNGNESNNGGGGSSAGASASSRNRREESSPSVRVVSVPVPVPSVSNAEGPSPPPRGLNDQGAAPIQAHSCGGACMVLHPSRRSRLGNIRVGPPIVLEDDEIGQGPGGDRSRASRRSQAEAAAGGSSASSHPPRENLRENENMSPASPPAPAADNAVAAPANDNQAPNPEAENRGEQNQGQAENDVDLDIEIVREIPVARNNLNLVDPRIEIYVEDRPLVRVNLLDSDSDSDDWDVNPRRARIRRPLLIRDHRPIVPEGVAGVERRNNNNNNNGENNDRAAPNNDQPPRDNAEAPPPPPAAGAEGGAAAGANGGGAGAGARENPNNNEDPAVARRNPFGRAQLRGRILGRPRLAYWGPAQAGRRPERYLEFYDLRNPVAPPLPDRPVTMTRDRMQSVNLAFPNLVKLTIQVSGPETCGLRYIFAEMKGLQVLKVIVESSLWKIKWDPLFTGIPEDFCDAVKSNSEIWDDVYITENAESIRNLSRLEELMLVESVKVDEREQHHQNLDERQISDVSFHFGFFKLKSLKRLTVTQGFSPSQTMYNRWYEEKGFKIKVKPKKRLDLNYYADQ